MQFRREYAFLSNFYSCDISIRLGSRCYKFRNAEAAFQACKCPERAGEFEPLDGKSAKRLGRQVKIRPDWNSVRIQVMRAILTAKFTQNESLKERLLGVTGPIMEENAWGDTFWGVCNGRGENHLGKLLMELRDRLSEETPSRSGRVSDLAASMGIPVRTIKPAGTDPKEYAGAPERSGS